jgi:cellulase
MLTAKVYIFCFREWRTANDGRIVYGVWVNGADKGDGRNVYVRSPPSNYPVKDVKQPALACNVNGGRAAPSFVQVAAGDRIEVEWYHDRYSRLLTCLHKCQL